MTTLIDSLSQQVKKKPVDTLPSQPVKQPVNTDYSGFRMTTPYQEVKTQSKPTWETLGQELKRDIGKVGEAITPMWEKAVSNLKVKTVPGYTETPEMQTQLKTKYEEEQAPKEWWEQILAEKTAYKTPEGKYLPIGGTADPLLEGIMPSGLKIPKVIIEEAQQALKSGVTVESVAKMITSRVPKSNPDEVLKTVQGIQKATKFTTGAAAKATPEVTKGIEKWNVVKEIEAEGIIRFKVYQNGQPIGYTWVSEGPDYIALMNSDTKIAFKRQGVSEAIHKELLNYAKSVNKPIFVSSLNKEGEALVKGLEAKGIIKLSPPDISEGKRLTTFSYKMERGTSPEVTKDTKFAGNIRLEKYPEDVRNIIKTWADENVDTIAKARRGIISDEQVLEDAKKLAEEVGSGFSDIVKKWKPGQAWNAEEITALRGALNSKSAEINNIKELISSGQDSASNLLKLTVAIVDHSGLQKVLTGVTAEAGRAERAFRRAAFNSLKANDTQRMEELLHRLGGRAKVEDIAEKLKSLDLSNPYEVNKFIRDITKPKWFDYVTEIYYNSILSNPKTHLVNFMSNTLNAIMSPFERGISATAEAVLSTIQRRPRQRFYGEVAQDLFGTLRGIPEGARSAVNIILRGGTIEEAIKWEMKQAAFTGKAGAVINFPSRLLEAADAFGKAINRTAALRAEAFRLASTSGKKGRAFLNELDNLMSNPTKELLEKASKIAEYRLFRQSPGKFVNSIMKLRDTEVLGMKPLKFVLPFIRTPANLVKYGVERSPLAVFNVNMWKNVIKKNPEAADQISRWVIGSVISSAVAIYVGDDKITGAAPTNQAERDAFYREGKQPYSIKVGDKWVSYQRLEPFNQAVAQVAAVVDAIQNKKDEDTIFNMALQSVYTIAQNFVSQTYMGNIADFLNAMEDPERNLGNWAKYTATGLVPLSGLIRFAAQTVDKTIRQPKTILEQFKSNIPVVSREVPAKINVFGEEQKRETPAWLPINISTEKNSRIDKMLKEADVSLGFVRNSINNVKMSDDEFYEYQKLAGEYTKEYLQKLADKNITNSKKIESTIDDAREKARNEMIKKLKTKYPEIIGKKKTTTTSMRFGNYFK